MSLIGQPFSQKTRDHFLPLLTSKAWWSETQIALRKVFEQDADFKDRMFARQIATMKGQAWNVVETLKTADHGPLELTRRPRVCVWDDLVDVPVAIPMRSAGSETQGTPSKPGAQYMDEDELDIGSVQRPNGFRNRQDLLNLNSPASLPSPRRFELSRQTTNDMLDDPITPATVHGDLGFHGIDHRDFINSTAIPTGESFDNHISFDEHVPNGPKHRRMSSGSLGSFYDSDGTEGDLGYVAAAVTEKITRKVIIERLEAVQSKNPVFTWC